MIASLTDLCVLEEELAEVGLGYPAAIVPVILPARQLYRLFTLYILYICTLPELQLYHLLQQVRLQGLEGLLGDAL